MAGAGGSDAFTYDPMNPVPTHGGNFCCLGGEPEGPFDQREVEARSDVLVYSTDPLRAPLDVAGSVEVVLHVSSDAPDTDITVKLVDVHPDGRAFNLDDSILRLRYREGLDRRAAALEEGETYEVRVGPLSVANVFQPGHRIRLEVSSSNFPRYDRNLNTGGNNWDESEGRVAENTVHWGGATPSRVVLPVRTGGVAESAEGGEHPVSSGSSSSSGRPVVSWVRLRPLGVPAAAEATVPAIGCFGSECIHQPNARGARRHEQPVRADRW